LGRRDRRTADKRCQICCGIGRKRHQAGIIESRPDVTGSRWQADGPAVLLRSGARCALDHGDLLPASADGLPSSQPLAGAFGRSPYWFGPGLPGIRQSAMKAMMDMIGMKSAAAMMPGRPMSCSRLTLSATFAHSETSTTNQKAAAQVWLSLLPSGTSVKR